MKTKEYLTLIICLTIIIVFLIIAYAYMNSPTEFVISLNTDNNTLKMMELVKNNTNTS